MPIKVERQRKAKVSLARSFRWEKALMASRGKRFRTAVWKRGIPGIRPRSGLLQNEPICLKKADSAGLERIEPGAEARAAPQAPHPARPIPPRGDGRRWGRGEHAGAAAEWASSRSRPCPVLKELLK